MKKDVKAFLTKGRETSPYRPVCERVKDYKEVTKKRSDRISIDQASRCMDCGTPFCHWGCPTGNLIPEWNEAMIGGDWEKAYLLLSTTNNLPEITGRVCPAICEYACVLGINDDPVTIRENELAIIEHAFNHGIITPQPPEFRTGKNVAIIGSGPAGVACADQLNKAGHTVTVYERDEKIGGIMRYGIPDFKLDKSIIDRRIALLEKEGISFKTNINVGVDISAEELFTSNDALCLTGGSRVPRDLQIDGREFSGIHFAMDYLIQSNRKVSGSSIHTPEIIDAKDKNVVVIGGGDTGSDCVGTAHRQGAACVVQIELLSKPAESRTDNYPWPHYPMLLKSSSSHLEGGERHWAILTKKFTGENNKVKKLHCIQVEFLPDKKKGFPVMKEIPGTEFEIDADLVILAIGFIHPEHTGLLDSLGIEYDKRGNVKTDEKFTTSISNVFTAGDMHRGQSLIVWAVQEGRKAAHAIDTYLMGNSLLPTM